MSLVIVNPIPAMTLPVAPPLPLTTGIRSHILEPGPPAVLPREEEKKNEKKETTAKAGESNNDDDVQLDREVLELMGGWVDGRVISILYHANKLFLCLRILSSLSPPPLSQIHLTATYRQALGSMVRGQFIHPHPFPQHPNGPSSTSTRKRSLEKEEAARGGGAAEKDGGQEEKKRKT